MNPFAELPLAARIALVVALVVIVGGVLMAFLLAEEAPPPPVDTGDSVPELDPGERHWVKRGPAGGR